MIFYIGPRVLLFTNPGGVKTEVSEFELIGIPMIIWSIILSAGVCLILWRLNAARINHNSPTPE